MQCMLIGAPVQTGTNQPGCVMGPDAFRSAGIGNELLALGHKVSDYGNLSHRPVTARSHPNKAVHHLAETSAWVETLMTAAEKAAEACELPIFLGGDHSLSAGTVPGLAAYAAKQGQPQFVLWLDAHTDLHRLDTTQSGNLHGTPLAYLTGQPGFEGYYPPLPAAVPAENVMLARYTPQRHRSLAFGFKFVISFTAAPLAIKLVALVQERTAEFTWLFLILTGIAGVAALAAVFLPGERRGLALPQAAE